MSALGSLFHWWKAQNILIKLLSPLLFFVAACCVCSIPVGLLSPTRTPTPSPRPLVNLPEPSPSPTFTPLPSPTTAPQPPTPEPTPSPQPPAPDTQPPADVQAYALELGQYTKDMGKALTSLGQLAQQSDFSSDDWKIQMAAQIAIIRLTHQNLVGMTVPPAMADIHTATLDATADCNESTNYLVSGLDNGNLADIETASELMASCGSKISRPNQMFQDYLTGLGDAAASPTEEAQQRASTIAPSVVAGSDSVNLRTGPGTAYPVAGSLAPAQALPITGRNADSSWWQVAAPTGPAWVNAGVVTTVNLNDSIPVVEAPPPPPPAAVPATAESVAVPSPTPLAVAPRTVPDVACDCSGDLYNCGDFASDAEAQGCLLHCQAAGAGDPHDLDRDHDGNACEWESD